MPALIRRRGFTKNSFDGRNTKAASTVQIHTILTVFIYYDSSTCVSVTVSVHGNLKVKP